MSAHARAHARDHTFRTGASPVHGNVSNRCVVVFSVTYRVFCVVYGNARTRSRGIERHRSEARDEHDFHFGIDFRRPARELDSVHDRHDNIGEE